MGTVAAGVAVESSEWFVDVVVVDVLVAAKSVAIVTTGGSVVAVAAAESSEGVMDVVFVDVFVATKMAAFVIAGGLAVAVAVVESSDWCSTGTVVDEFVVAGVEEIVVEDEVGTADEVAWDFKARRGADWMLPVVEPMAVCGRLGGAGRTGKARDDLGEDVVDIADVGRGIDIAVAGREVEVEAVVELEVGIFGSLRFFTLALGAVSDRREIQSSDSVKDALSFIRDT